MTILVARHFDSGMLQFEKGSNKLGWDIFLIEIGDLTKSALSGRAYPPLLWYSSMILVPREAENLSETRFSLMLIPFVMFLFDSGEGKASKLPL